MAMAIKRMEESRVAKTTMATTFPQLIFLRSFFFVLFHSSSRRWSGSGKTDGESEEVVGCERAGSSGSFQPLTAKGKYRQGP